MFKKRFHENIPLWNGLDFIDLVILIKKINIDGNGGVLCEDREVKFKLNLFSFINKWPMILILPFELWLLAVKISNWWFGRIRYWINWMMFCCFSLQIDVDKLGHHKMKVIHWLYFIKLNAE